jgi:hypothetical protein
MPVRAFNGSSSNPARLKGCLAVLLTLASGMKPAIAEEPRPDPLPQSGWQFNLVGFAWMPSITGSATVRGRGFDDNASFTEIVRKSESVLAFMSHIEAQKDGFGMFVEPIWMKLGFGSPNNVLFTKLTTDITYVEFGGFYRPFQGVAGPARHPWFVDALVGARYTNLKASLSLSSLVGGSSFSQSKSWVDPFIGARARIEMTPGWDFQLRGDVGGFGVGSQFSWNLVALVGHRFGGFRGGDRRLQGPLSGLQDRQRRQGIPVEQHSLGTCNRAECDVLIGGQNET